jgi:hypothetical protein
MVRSRISRRLCGQIAGGLMALVVGLGFAGGALAGNTVSTTVTGGTLSASIADLALPSVAYSHTDVTKTGIMTLTADDSSGTNAGWNVQVIASNFVYSGAYGGTNIPNTNFALTSAAAPIKLQGQGVSTSNGPMVPSASPLGTLNVARKVVQADVNHGKGEYSQALGVSLLVPADSVAGTYTSTLTVTITAGP